MLEKRTLDVVVDRTRSKVTPPQRSHNLTYSPRQSNPYTYLSSARPLKTNNTPSSPVIENIGTLAPHSTSPVDIVGGRLIRRRSDSTPIPRVLILPRPDELMPGAEPPTYPTYGPSKTNAVAKERPRMATYTSSDRPKDSVKPRSDSTQRNNDSPLRTMMHNNNSASPDTSRLDSDMRWDIKYPSSIEPLLRVSSRTADSYVAVSPP